MEFEDLGQVTKKFTIPSNVKKYLPFILIGGVVGGIALIRKPTSSQTGYYQDETSKVGENIGGLISESNTNIREELNSKIGESNEFILDRLNDTEEQNQELYMGTLSVVESLSKQMVDERKSLFSELTKIQDNTKNQFDVLSQTYEQKLNQTQQELLNQQKQFETQQKQLLQQQLQNQLNLQKQNTQYVTSSGNNYNPQHYSSWDEVSGTGQSSESLDRAEQQFVSDLKLNHGWVDREINGSTYTVKADTPSDWKPGQSF